MDKRLEQNFECVILLCALILFAGCQQATKQKSGNVDEQRSSTAQSSEKKTPEPEAPRQQTRQQKERGQQFDAFAKYYEQVLKREKIENTTLHDAIPIDEYIAVVQSTEITPGQHAAELKLLDLIGPDHWDVTTSVRCSDDFSGKSQDDLTTYCGFLREGSDTTYVLMDGVEAKIITLGSDRLWYIVGKFKEKNLTFLKAGDEPPATQKQTATQPPSNAPDHQPFADYYARVYRAQPKQLDSMTTDGFTVALQGHESFFDNYFVSVDVLPQNDTKQRFISSHGCHTSISMSGSKGFLVACSKLTAKSDDVARVFVGDIEASIIPAGKHRVWYTSGHIKGSRVTYLSPPPSLRRLPAPPQIRSVGGAKLDKLES